MPINIFFYFSLHSLVRLVQNSEALTPALGTAPMLQEPVREVKLQS